MADPITQLMLRRGDIAAESAERSGQIWGNVLGNIGKIGAAAGENIANAQQEKKAQKQLAMQDAALVHLIESSEGPPDVKSLTKIVGPKRALELAQGFEAFERVKQASADKQEATKAKAREGLPSLIRGMDSLSEPLRAGFYANSVRPEMVRAGLIGEDEIPADYTPEGWAQIREFGKAMAPKREPIKVGNSLVDPDTMQPVYTEAPEPKKHVVTTAGPDGRPVTKLATEEELAAGVPAYREPKAPDREPLVAVIGDDGNPVYMPRSQASGRRPASNREQGRPVTSGDADKLAEGATSLDDLAVLGEELRGSKATGASAAVGAALPNFVTELTGWGTDAKQKQATIDRVRQVIGKALEEGVLRKEDEAKYMKILPTIGDTADVVQSKLDGLEQALTRGRQRLLESLSDAGYDTSRYEARDRGEKSKGDKKPAGKNPFR